jgi:hypothetical protein
MTEGNPPATELSGRQWTSLDATPAVFKTV